MQTDFYEDRLRVYLNVLKNAACEQDIPLDGFLFKPCGYKTGNALPKVDESFRAFGRYERWGGEKDCHAWFYKQLEIPESMRGKNAELCISTQLEGWDSVNPQFIVYVNGKLVQGLDTNHREVFLDNAESAYEIYVYAYGGKEANHLEFNANLRVYNEEIRKLYYSLCVPYEATLLLDPNEKAYVDMQNCLEHAVNLIDLRDPRSGECMASVRAAQQYLDAELLNGTHAEFGVNALCIGHTHIDVAWLWTLAQTREKVLRSFSTVLALMKKYPEYKFMSSQAQLYKYLKEESPELYDEVKEMVKQGRWEVEGAMWVEADCNLSSGESLVRQILYGKSFFKEEFGADCKVLWLPDVFGYSAALPQILKKSGVESFVTSKIGWNESNRMPYDTFWWQGIDGTDIFSFFMTAQDKVRGQKPARNVTYNAKLNPCQLMGAWDRYQQKQLQNEVMITFGYGDGGGGPVRKDLEYYNILKKGLPAVPKAKMEFAGEMLARMRQKAEKDPKTPHWQGELYLEYHRGTYTSQAKNKRYNRKSEFLYQNAESFALADMLLNGAAYPETALHDGWETILLNQFHDIIPGSSIHEVYEVSHAQYESIGETGAKICTEASAHIAENIGTDGGILVWNPNAFEASGTVCVDGETRYVEHIPPKGYKVVADTAPRKAVQAGEAKVENDFFLLEFDESGAFTRIYDKKNRREVLKSGARGNVMTAYEDYPRNYDNWEISNYYKEKSWTLSDKAEITPIADGARAGVEVKKIFMHSTITQKIWLYDDTARIDFDTDIDWNESHLILKTAFPVEVLSDKATYEIQFGAVERPTHTNTSWDAAKFEVCAHKYADLSEYGYGVSLLNDCKYGHDIHDGVMRLTLLKCGTYPDETADRGAHTFTYSLYPHAGDYRAAGTVQQAYLLNNPLTAQRIGAQNGSLPESFSLLVTDCENVIAETVKKAEKGDAVIVRLYEAYRQRADVTVRAGFDFKEVSVCDLLENAEYPLEHDGRTVKLSVKPYEIVTLRFAIQ
ncbi:MAG: alpha-mannosidase [Lachnospiraceae bacterium]